MPNTSKPTPVLRIGGTDFDIDAALLNVKIEPYRIDRAGSDRATENALYFEVPLDDFPATSLSAALQEYLTANQRKLCQLRQMPGVAYFELDIGIVIDDGMMSRSTVLEPEVLAALAALNLTCIVSAYRGGEI